MSINWAYDEQPREFYLYRGVDDTPISLLKTLPGAQRSYIDQGVKRGKTYRYLIRAIFPGGKVSPFTQELSILME